MATPIPTEIAVVTVGQLQHSPNGHPFVEGHARGGIVAFWGGPGNMENIRLVQHTQPPFTIICDCIKSNWPNHALWIPEKGEIYFIEPTKASSIERAVGVSASAAAVTLAELAEWRHGLVSLVAQLEKAANPENPSDGLAGRIARLSHQGVVPREIAALMRAVSEMRNAAEYEAKVLTPYESLAIRNAWEAIQQWWKRRKATTV